MDEARPGTTSARGPVRADGRRSHQELLTAARDTFAADGTDASLREVARRAGVSIATLYRHFPTREALLEALLSDAFEALVSRAGELVAVGDPGQAFTAWIRELTEGVARYDGLPAAVATALHDPDSTLHASCTRLGATTADLLTRAQRSGAIREDLQAGEVLSLVSAVAWAARQTGPADRPEGAPDRHLDLLIEGLATQSCELPAKTQKTLANNPSQHDDHTV